jgi:hypothetical protein
MRLALCVSEESLQITEEYVVLVGTKEDEF